MAQKIRMISEDLKMGKAAIRSVFDLNKKDKDPELYRVLIPLVKDSTSLVNIVEAFIESKENCDIKQKYTFHCADKKVVNAILESIDKGSICEYREFDFGDKNE